MKKLDIKLYKMHIIPGKEETAREWLSFLGKNAQDGVETLKNEKIFLESYFLGEENGTMVVYLMIAGDDIDFANKTAYESKNPLDIQHFAYAAQCVDQSAGDIMDAVCYIENLDAAQ